MANNEAMDIDAIAAELAEIENKIRELAIQTRGQHPKDIYVLKERALSNINGIAHYAAEIGNRMYGGK